MLKASLRVVNGTPILDRRDGLARKHAHAAVATQVSHNLLRVIFIGLTPLA